ncbi:Gaa1-like protein [Xylaria bambusicola]|uniref:Gaa1-like protein n=1 Tax=Xylaria bambusicola TaxID=326684 RepID=UPI00200812FA|nr:Gaa1-like protein [Xylaria bambusicola]KAI0503334.1 Gaa1-like protein [Xylaria bambusicola]
MPNVQSFNAQRARSYLLRLPLFTRAMIAIMIAFGLVGLQGAWNVREWGALIPRELNLTTMYRVNTFPLIHKSLLHTIFNILALTPLLERFETEFGTLTSLALFFGPLTTIPALVYVFFDRFVLGANHAVLGASLWVFLLLGMEGVRTYKTNPYLVIGTYHVPTWTTPLFMAVIVQALVPGTSFVGHLCGVGTGYLFGLGYLKFLAPPEWILREIESRLNLLGRLPHYVSIDQKTYGRFGVLPTNASSSSSTPMTDELFHDKSAMPRLLATVLTLRRDPRLLKLPPYLSLLCILVGVAWLFLLPLDDYSRRTYISENALLPGQVHTYFGGSDQNVFRAYRHEVDALKDKTNLEINGELENIFKGLGFKVGRQNYTYYSAGSTYAGENAYAILQAPRGDATEAIVLVSAWKNVKGELNRNGVALTLTLARYFKRWSLWSKDIIIVIPPDSRAAIQAWVDAYHDAHDPSTVAALPIKSGLLQGAVAIDYPHEGRFEGVHIVYDGVNGQLPNLDLINSVNNIANGQMVMHSFIQGRLGHSDKYNDRLKTMLRGMMKQGLGHAVGPHSSFIPYHVDAVTLQPVGNGGHDEMGLGRLIEGTFRSLNNLLEHLHQSFFFYLLIHKDRFVSIGTYLPSAMLIAVNFTIMAILMWVKSGAAGTSGSTELSAIENTDTMDGKKEAVAVKPLVPAVAERELYLPLGIVIACHFLGALPLFIFNHTPSHLLAPFFVVFGVLNIFFPSLILKMVNSTSARPLALQQIYLLKSFSLLLLGMFLSSLATLNFSLAFLVGLISTPLSFASPWPDNPAMRFSYTGLLQVVSPTAAVLAGAAAYASSYGSGETGLPDTLAHILSEAAFGWDVWGLYTPLIVWCVWWPAWLVGSIVVLGQPKTMAKMKSA